MAASVHQIIGKVCPLYAENKEELIKKYKSWNDVPAGDVKAKPLQKHIIVYDSSAEQLEPVYFYVLDLMSDMGLTPEKIIDNFTSSPGSGHFSELGQRATIMQQQGTRILGDINNVMRSILNLVYDLKEFKIRLESYNDLKSSKPETKEGALLSLKQIWMDRVDINKGNSSIKGMAVSGGVGYQTLIDAFLFVKDEKSVEKVDLNDRVKRVIKQRIHEFNLWLSQSESELRKRYELERKYLKSQVNSVKIYARWAKPYLKAAQQLEMKDSSDPALVKVFNTMILELTLLGKSKLNVESAAIEGALPKDFLKFKVKRNLTRDYFGIAIVELNFRGIPQKVNPYQQHYTFGGRVDITFTGYTLNSEELKKVKEEISKSDLEDAMGLVEGATLSIEDMQKDIDMFLKEEEKAEKKAEKMSTGINPFAALLGFYDKEEKTSKAEAKKADKGIKPDSFLEKNYLRPMAAESIKETTFTLFDIYKKSHGMPSYPPNLDRL